MTHSRRKANRIAQDSHRKEILTSKVRLDGVGEDPAVRDLLRELATADNSRALEIGLAIQSILRGDDAMVNDPRQAETLAKTKEEWAAQDRAAENFEKNPNAFIDEAYENGLKALPKGEALDKLRAKASKQVSTIMANARILGAQQDAGIARELQYGPKVEIDVPAQFEMVKNGENSYAPVAVPLVLRLRRRAFELKPGKQLVPKLVADIFLSWKKQNDENDARGAALQTGGHWGTVKKEWKRIDRDFQSNSNLPA